MPNMSRAIFDRVSSFDPLGITATLLLGLIIALAMFKLWNALSRFNGMARFMGSDEAQKSTTPFDDEDVIESDVNKGRQPGEWNPVKFSYPSIEACPQRLSEIKPIPYRPFRWGAYHVTMGIRNMPWNDWIELDMGHGKYHEIKSHRMKIRGQAAVRVLGDQELVKGGAEAEYRFIPYESSTGANENLTAVELVHELAEYLSRRFPSDFSVTRHSKRIISPDGTFCDWGWEGLPPIEAIRITSLDISYDLPSSVDDGNQAPERAMQIAGLLIQDDLAVMIEGLDGRYYFQAGSICVPGFWRMQDKIGLPLDDIHISGKVPQWIGWPENHADDPSSSPEVLAHVQALAQGWTRCHGRMIKFDAQLPISYREKLQTSLERFFRRLPVDKPVIRNNYFIQANRRRESGAHEQNESGQVVDPEELGWAESTLGSEETYEHGSMRPAFAKAVTEKDMIAIDWIRLRTERQTLRRLPRSGAVVFTIRTYLTPVTALGKERGIPGRMASALRSWPEDVGEYKGKFKGGWYGPLLDYLDKCDGEQGSIGAGEVE
ncbi:hypothetical protein CPB84DRAFT_1741949 [Gymnopilus junonius]|uniref:Uncharacterized protein n=1 Tax=Gymnopilus junonius TaxID=109634 RepID=A0A9P5P1S0_GYMJU|nr:hypothetical protein CPB84DRAFT_1741949 [Gymnopilus junonius]